MQANRPIVLAAGGTGGHIFPAEALAEELVARGFAVHLITDHRFSDYAQSSLKGIFGQVPIHPIRASSLGGKPWRKLYNLLMIGVGILQARAILKKLKPAAVVGFGGYPSFPGMLAASQLRLPTIIHEQNALLGKTNRVLARRVTAIAASFDETAMVDADLQHKVTVVGNPVRSAVRALRDVPTAELSRSGIMRILVTGGSQGARVFSTIVPQAVALLPEALRTRLRIDQQARPEMMEETKKAYAAIGVAADLAPFFTDVAARLAAAHLVICRSGASTMAELTCAGRPAILVPYPYAADDHQTANATALDDGGGGWLMPEDGFTPEALAAKLESFLTLPATLGKAADAARRAGRPEAAKRLADLVIAQMKRDGVIGTAAVGSPPAKEQAA